ncbi:MAG: PqqD family protein [Candidatus Eremiobacteraeota bacterium]|nr:PqqD family protein [Candidatus Eremiobacteraeota bacterium]
MSELCKSPGLDIKTVGDEVLVHHPAGQKVHILNRTAGRILELCDGVRTPSEIAAMIGAETGADQATVDADVRRIVADFVRLGLIA